MDRKILSPGKNKKRQEKLLELISLDIIPKDNTIILKLIKYYNTIKDTEMMALQCKFPVIFLSFRGCSASTLETTKKLIIAEIRQELLRYYFIKEHLPEEYKQEFEPLMKSTDEDNIIKSILQLCRFIHLALGIKPILLIDEYDNPINNTYVKGFYEPLIDFLKPFNDR